MKNVRIRGTDIALIIFGIIFFITMIISGFSDKRKLSEYKLLDYELVEVERVDKFSRNLFTPKGTEAQIKEGTHRGHRNYYYTYAYNEIERVFSVDYDVYKKDMGLWSPKFLLTVEHKGKTFQILSNKLDLRALDLPILEDAYDALKD